MFSAVLILIFVGASVATNIIVPTESAVNLCKNCKHFMANDSMRCSRFKTVNVITGKEKDALRYAKSCRNDENLCGLEGRFYESNTELNMFDTASIVEQLMILKSLQKKEISIGVLIQIYELINNISTNIHNHH